MRKSEMSSNQVLLRKELLTYFKINNWNDTSTDWFEKNLWSEYEITVEHKNPSATLELEFSFTDDLFNLILTSKLGERGLYLTFHPKDKMIETIDKINSIKRKINLNNIEQNINEIIKICPNIYYDDEN